MSENEFEILTIKIENITTVLHELRADFKADKEKVESKNILCVQHDSKLNVIEKEINEMKKNRIWLQRTIIGTSIGTIMALLTTIARYL